MYLSRRLLFALLSIGFAFITACNPVPLSVVASDFSINGVKGTSITTGATSTNTATSTTTGTGTSTSGEQSVAIDLTTKETCSTLTSLVASVKLAEGVTISPNPAVARDYTSPVTFTVTESYGGKVVYTVTVKGTACTVIKVPAIVPSTVPAGTTT